MKVSVCHWSVSFTGIQWTQWQEVIVSEFQLSLSEDFTRQLPTLFGLLKWTFQDPGQGQVLVQCAENKGRLGAVQYAWCNPQTQHGQASDVTRQICDTNLWIFKSYGKEHSAKHDKSKARSHVDFLNSDRWVWYARGLFIPWSARPLKMFFSVLKFHAFWARINTSRASQYFFDCYCVLLALGKFIFEPYRIWVQEDSYDFR